MPMKIPGDALTPRDEVTRRSLEQATPLIEIFKGGTMPSGPTGEDRRSVVNGRPPTYLMQSYGGMTPQKKKELKHIGYGLLVFSFVVPVLASIGLRAFGLGLPMVIWLFCGVGMIVGLSLAWPELGIYMLGRLPVAVGKLLPKSWASALKRPERRNNDNQN